VLLLTTHSMEEADVLGDRVAVFAGGRLRCLGTALHLKTRHGQGYRLSISLQQGSGTAGEQPAAAAVPISSGSSGSGEAGGGGPSSHQAIQALVQQVLSCSVTAHEAGEACVQFQLPSSCQEKLPELLQQLEGRAQELGVAGVQVGMAPLEEVFLRAVAAEQTVGGAGTRA
jgi:ABC-type multidrug transport system ATPase subunit